ncbi:MAG: iron-containing alcohol dehydrogenase [Ruminococcaceae bacterium]|nr:iron-containing alcohol dehydrogenase [Oscillospiraceae bacterium]
MEDFMNFEAHKPVKLIFGENCVKENCEVFRTLGKRAMVVTGKTSADKCGAMADVAAALEAAGCEYVRFSGIPENPPAPLCYEGGELARQEGCDFVIGIGGGSAIDAAKAIAGYASNPQCDVMGLFDDSIRTNDCLPIVAIPTTAGTGSEACRYSVLTTPGGKKKRTFKTSSAYPKYSFVCPRYSATMSDKYTVSTALDALAHAIEAYFSPKACDESREASLYAAKEIWEVLFMGADGDGRGYTDRQRERLSKAATAAGIAIDYCGTGFPHPLGYGLSLEYGVPHGSACALFDGAFIRYNMITKEGKRRAEELAEYIGTTTDEMIRRIPEMSGVDMKLSKEVREELIDRVAEAGNYANSIYKISRGEMSDIYKRTFE